MRGKFMIMALLCALLVGLVPPSSAHAQATELSFYDAETKTIYYNGKSCYVGDDCASYISEGCNMVYYTMNNGLYILIIPDSDMELGYWESGNRFLNLVKGGRLVTSDEMPSGVVLYYYAVDASSGDISYSRYVTGVNNIFTTSQKDKDGNTIRHIYGQPFNIFYSDMNVYKCNFVSVTSSDRRVELTEDVYYVSDVGQIPLYSFYKWCKDASVNCSASTKANANVYDKFIYNPKFRYIVTKNADGYEVTQIYSNEELDQFTGLCSYDNKIYLRSKDDLDVDFNVKKYIYSYDGWVVKSSEFHSLYGIEMVDLGISVSASNQLCYSSNNIMTGQYYGNIYFAKSVEFADGFSGEVDPDPNPMITPTPTPNVPSGGGSGSVGGLNIVTYTSQIKAEVKANSVTMRDYPSLEGNAIAAFIKTWHIDVLGYVYDADGATWYYCKTIRDDMEYIGFIKAEYLTVLSVENNDIGFGDISLDDAPEMIETAKNSFKELLGLVGVVPMMIGAVFGFLPSWCLGIVCITVIALCLVALIKRG